MGGVALEDLEPGHLSLVPAQCGSAPILVKLTGAVGVLALSAALSGRVDPGK
jgi:hypothetical protein